MLAATLLAVLLIPTAQGASIFDSVSFSVVIKGSAADLLLAVSLVNEGPSGRELLFFPSP